MASKKHFNRRNNLGRDAVLQRIRERTKNDRKKRRGGRRKKGQEGRHKKRTKDRKKPRQRKKKHKPKPKQRMSIFTRKRRKGIGRNKDVCACFDYRRL